MRQTAAYSIRRHFKDLAKIAASLLSNAAAPRNFDVSCAWIIGLAILLRTIWIAIIPVDPVSDSVAYDTFARNLAEHQVYGWNKDEPFAFWPPGTSFIYAALYSLFGHAYWTIGVFNVAISAGIIFLTMRLGNRLFNAEVALIAGAIVAFWPSLILYCTVLASELPYLFLTLWALVVWLDPSKKKLTIGIMAGALLGLACYVRPTALLLPFMFSIPLIVQGKFSKAAWRGETIKCLIAFATMLALILPWTYRNYVVYNEPVLISTNGGITFWMGNSPGTTGEYARIPEWAAQLNDFERSRALSREAKAYIAEKPGEFVLRTIYKAYFLHRHETIGVTWNVKGISKVLGENLVLPLKMATTAYWYMVLVLSIIGVVLMFKIISINTIAHPLIITWIYYVTVHSIIVAQDRYHFSYAPHLAIVAAFSIFYALQARRESFLLNIFSQETGD